MSTSELRGYLFLAMLGVLLWAMRRAAGRLAPRVAIAPLVFLITRVPVMVAWGIGAAVMLSLILPQAIALGHDSLKDVLMLGGLCVFCGLGFAALALGPTWMLVRAFAKKTDFPLEPGEQVLRETTANHFVGGEARGGKLIVTTRRLGFRPHRFNVQLATWSVPLEAVRGFDFSGDRFLLVDTEAAPGKPQWVVVPRPRDVAAWVSALSAVPEAERPGVVAPEPPPPAARIGFEDPGRL